MLLNKCCGADWRIYGMLTVYSKAKNHTSELQSEYFLALTWQVINTVINNIT